MRQNLLYQIWLRIVILWHRVDDRILFILLALIIGLVGGYSAVIFHHAIGFSRMIFFQRHEELFGFHLRNPLYLPIMVMSGIVLVSFIGHWFLKGAGGHGVPEVILAAAHRGTIQKPSMHIIRAFSSAICIGSGASVGPEGPVIQLGSAIGQIVGRLFRITPEKMRVLLGCGAAAGISATFNAPLAGVVFATEVILSDFTFHTLTPIVVSSVMAAAVSRHFLGVQPAFPIPETFLPLKGLGEFGLYVLLGILGGLLSVYFIRILYFVEEQIVKLKIDFWKKAMLGGLLVGIVGIILPQLMGVGYNVIHAALLGKLNIFILILVMLLKPIATATTIGVGGYGGVFAPSLVTGAMLGGAFGVVANWLNPQLFTHQGEFVLIGAASLVAGTMHSPITAILIVFEMTNDYHIILPLMFASTLSAFIARIIFEDSVYTLPIRKKGETLAHELTPTELDKVTVGSVMQSSFLSVPENKSLGEILETIQKYEYRSFAVLNKQGDFVGMVSLYDVHNVILESDLYQFLIAKDFVVKDLPRLNPSDSLTQAFRQFAKARYESLPVVDEDNPRKIVGIITEFDIYPYFLKSRE